MTSYDLSMFDTPRQPKAPEAKYDLSMLDQGQPKTIWQPLQPEQVQAATTIASFGDSTKSANMDKLRSELRQYLGDDAPMVGSLNFEDAQRQLQRAQMDHTLRDSPHTARWFTEQVQQGKTPYDVGTLANIERVTRVAPLLPYAAARGAYRTVGGLPAVPGAFADVVGQALEPVFGKLPKSELTNIGEFITEYGRKVTGSVPDNLTIGEKGLVSGVESLGANLTTFGMAPFGLQATLGTMSASVGGSTYLENLKATDSPAIALLHGILDAGYEYIFERMGGTGVLFDKAAWAKTFLGGVAKFAAREIPTELATTVAQKADQYILQNPERTFEQFMSELPEDLAVTAIATLVGGGGQVAIFKGVEALANTGNTTAKAQAAHDNLAALLDNVAKSELYLNDPDTFAQFFQGVAGDTTVTVDPVKLVEAMTAANVTEEALPSLKDQINAPGEIELTVQELATAFAGTGAETTLLQHVRPEPDLPTLAESKEQTKAAFEAFQAAGEKAMAKFQADEVANSALDAIQEDIAADVQATGMFGPHYASGYGTLMRHFYATMAKAHGVSPLQIRDGWTDANGVEHRGYNPRVIGPTGQVRGRSPATTTDFKPGRVANLRNRDNWAVLEAGNPNGTEATPEENAASMAKLKAYLDGEGIEYHDAKGSYFGTKADSLMLLGVTAERASEIGNMFGQESIATRHGLVFGDGTVAQATGIKEVKDTEAEDHTFLPAFGSAFRLEIPESAFENRVKLNEVLNQSVSTRTPTQKAGRGDPHLTTDLDVDYNVVEQDADLVARMATVVKTYPGIKKGLRNPNKIVEAFIKHVEDNLSWLYDNVPPEIRERSKLWYDGGRRIVERWTDKYGFTDAQIAGVIAVSSPQTEWDMNVTRAERILDIWTQQQDFAWSDEMNAEADAIDSIKPVLREAIRGKKLSELDSDLLRGVWIRVYDQAHNPRVVRGITPEGGFAAFKKTMAGKVKTSTWGSFAEIGKAVRILRDGSIPNISRSLGNEHKVRNFYNNLFDPSDSRSVTIDTHAVAAGLLRPLAGGSIEVSDNLGARPRHDPTGTNGTYVLYAEAYRRVAMAKGVLPRELQSIAWEAVRRLFPDNYKNDATRAEIDALWKPNETGKESADEIRNKILENRGGRIPNPAWERSGTGLDVGQPSSTYQDGILERSWADGTPGTRAGGYFAQTVPATGKPAGLTITGAHFSPGEQTSLLPSKYGKGLEGAERARVMASKDARIKRRTHFYVNTGQGVFPEYGVGAKAHVSELANLYDADVDALGLFEGKTDEQLNAAESAVLDAGYSGYVMRGFGNQGAAVVFGARVGDPGKPDAEVLRPVVVTGTDLMGDGRGFTEFFSEASKGNRAPEEPYKPVLDIGGISEFSEEYVKHRGNFDDHIASSIPGFREVQQIVGDAITKAYPGGAALLDLGASEGAFGKAITAVSGGAVRTLSLDPNLEMANFFSEHSQVPGADYVVAALGSPEDAGKTAWTEGDTPIPFFAPTQAYDIIHEAMVFQFISNGRNAQVARVKEMLKPGGVAFFEEKTADDSPEFVANEAQKDAFKNQFFSKRQIEEKNKEVLARGAEAVAEEEKKREQNTVGMNDLMTTRKELEAVLLRNFKHVVQYWDSGNFAGYMASDDPNALKKLEGNMLPTDSEFAAISTPRKVTSPAPLATKERGIPTKFVGGKEEASVPVAPAAQYSETQRLRQALTTSKDLPHGAMTAARWREYIGKVLPDLLPKIEASGAFERVHGMVYRDELARAIEPPEGQFYQKVWHGTPHIWAPEPGFPHGRPRLDKMGTGEGAQAYGWGFYIAEAEEVGAGYQKTLAFRAFDIAQEAEKRGISLNDGAHGEIVRHSATDRTPQEAAKYVQYANSASRSIPLEDLAQFIADYREASRGSLYQLDIPDAALPYLLDWDKPLSEQTKEVRDAINTVAAWKLSDDSMAMSYKGKTGRDFYGALVALQGSKKSASNVLARLGIVGNRYLDGQSRNRPLKDIKREFLAELPEDADFSEVSDMIGTGRFSPKNDALLKALRDDDWLGFDYPAQAISAALGKDLSGYDASPALLRAVESAKEGGTYNYVIWDQPTLDKIALLERNGEKLDAMQQFYQAGWYSPLTRAFQNAKQATMPGSQWASWLAGNKAKLGLKDDEIVFSGLDNYLELRGKDKVTREEIVDYLSGNGVRVEETVLGGAQGITKKDLDNAEVEARRTGDWTAYEDLTRRYEDEQIGNDANGSGNKTLYASYVPPGGIPGTYWEILVALPEKGRAEFERIKAKVDNDEPLTPEENEIYGTYEPGADVYRSHHWNGVPNVLAHLRVDEVEGADGQRVLRVIEVQSDWGQQGKKEGFGEKLKEGWRFWKDENGRYQVLGPGRTFPYGIADTEQMAMQIAKNFDGLEHGRVASAPFVTDTKAWVALGIKRAIMHAVDVGATGVVFATGEQNAALYSLEKQVDAISYAKTSDGKYVVSALKDGHSVLDKTGTPEELESVVGKEIVKKMLAGLGREVGAPEGSGELSGLDLKVGGEGMKAFYDKIVPQVANDVLKKLGAGVKAEKFTVPTPVDEATTDRALVMDEDIEHFGFRITPEFRAKVMEGVPLFQVKPAYAVRSPDGKYQGIRELTDKEARELIDLGYQVNRVTPGYGQAENAMGGFNPSTLEITLLAKANPSTFLHETGHFFLTAYADMASQEGAPQQIVDDMNALLKMFGIADLATWNNMSTDEQRPYHEQFAESFEQYLFSGKAPIKDLQTLFRRFATWLTKVYGSIKEFIAGHPGAQLNPDLAAIMDRMLATEAEIAAAEDNRNYEALFRTAAEAGMTPAQFAAYLDLPEEARAAAEEQLRTRSLRDMKWLQNRKNKTVAALQKEAAAVRAEVRKEVAETVAQEPIFRALRWLKRGELTNPDTGEEVKVTAGNKLSIPALEGMYPEGALGDKPDWRSLGYGQYGMLANEGLHPDVVADMFGFDSGAALVDALVNAPKFKDEVEGRTDQIMLERHGDLSSPDKIAQAADEAIHNEVRTKIVATELSFLDKLTGSPSFLIKAAKEYARQLVANRTSKTLKAWVFAADEVRASKAAAAALKKGDTKAAANHKRVELLNHTAVREAHAAEKELKKIVDRLRKIASYKDDDSSAKARDMDMVNAVRVVLYRFGLGTERKGKTATEYLSLVEANDPAMGAALRDLVDSTTDSAKDWRDLKLSELRDLRDAVESVWALAKRSRQMEVDGKLVPRRQVEQELYDRLDEIGIPDRLPGEGQAVTEAERNWMKFATFVAALRRVESWVGAKDGKAMGPFRKYIWSQIKDAADTYRVKKAEYLKAYRELLDTIAPTLKRELIDAREIGYTFGKGEGGMGMVELLHAILHTGNASNKRKLLLGRGWATDNGDGTMDTSKWDAFITRMIQEGKLTKAHYDFAQGVWDMLDGMKPAAQKAHRSVFGRYFAEVTADAFTTPFGDYRGGYVPAQADPEIVQDAQLKELANQENENMVYAFPSTPRGFTKSRVEYNRPLRLDLRSLAGHIDKVLLFSYLTEPVSDVRRVILSKTVSQALGRVDPKAIGSILTPWLNRTAKQIVEDRVPGREPLARFWSAARARAGMSAMFANLANSAQQITGVSLAALKARPKYLLEALAHGVASPRKLSDHVASVSPYMRDRMHNDIVLMGEAIDEILLNPTLLQSAKAWSSKHAYFMQRAVDNFFSPMVWMGAFNQAKENGSDDLEARRLADSAVRETQGSQAPEDIAAFEQGTAFYRMFVQFAGYFNMNANLLGTEFVKLSQDMGLKKGAGRGLYVLALGFYVPAVLGELIIQAFRGGPDDDDKDGEYLDDWLAAVFGYGPARYLTAMVPVVGQAANALVNTLNHKPYDDRISTAPAISMIESAVKAPISVYKAIADEGKSTKAINDTATLISMTVGVPARAVAKPISYLTGVANEEIAPEDTYDAIRGTITGTASPGSKQ